MSNKERRSHPIHILVMWFNWLKGFLIPLLILGLSGNIRRRFWLLALITGLAVIVGLLTSFLQWRRFTYRLDEDQLLVRKGVFTQEEKFISFSKIQSVNMEESLFHRIYRLCSLRIEPAGGEKKGDAVLPAISLQEAERIRSVIYEKRSRQDGEAVEERGRECGEENVGPLPEQNREKQPPLLTLGPEAVLLHVSGKQLLYAAMTSGNIGLTFAFLGVIYQTFDKVIPEKWLGDVFQQITQSGFSVIALICLLLGGAAWFISLVLYSFKYWGFKVLKRGDEFVISYGLVNKHSLTFHPSRVQAVQIVEGVLRKPFGFASIQLAVINAKSNEKVILHPFIQIEHMPGFLQEVLPKYEWYPIEKKAPKQSFYYFVRFGILLSLVLAAVLIYFFPVYGWFAIALPVLDWFWAKAMQRGAGLSIRPGQLIARSRFLALKTTLVRRRNIQQLSVTKTIFQDRKGIANLKIGIKGGLASSEIEVDYLAKEDVQQAWDWFQKTAPIDRGPLL